MRDEDSSGRVVAVEVLRSSQILDTYGWETELSRFDDRLVVGCKRVKGVKGNSQILGLRNRKMELPFTDIGRLQEDLLEGGQEFDPE